MNTIAIEMEKTDYTGGETVTGKVKLVLSKTIPVRGVRLRFNGYEISCFSRRSGKNNANYREERHIFGDELTLAGKPSLTPLEILEDAVKGFFSSDRYDVMQPGEYTYDFSYPLPGRLPADYIRGGVRIVYEVAAYVDIPLRFDIKTRQKLTVYETYDESVAKPVRLRTSKHFLMDANGKVDMDVTLDKNMFFPGDDVHGVLKLTNSSTKKIDGFCIWLYKVTELRAKNTAHSETGRTQLLNVHNPGLLPGNEAELGLNFKIPAQIYSSSYLGQLVKVRHEIGVSLDIPWAKDPETRIRVVILEKAGMPSGFHNQKK